MANARIGFSLFPLLPFSPLHTSWLNERRSAPVVAYFFGTSIPSSAITSLRSSQVLALAEGLRSR